MKELRVTVIIFIALLLCTDSSARSRRNRPRKVDKDRDRERLREEELERMKQRERPKMAHELNLCNIQGEDLAFHCLCTSGRNLKDVSDANCWVSSILTK